MSGLAIVFHFTARLSFDGKNVAIVIVFSLFIAYGRVNDPMAKLQFLRVGWGGVGWGGDDDIL